MQSEIFVGKGGTNAHLLLKMANRHGLIAGATGTGKTVTLKLLAEGFSAAGVPVFMADVKGDLAGLCQAGIPSEKLAARAAQVGVNQGDFQSFPVMFWDLFGKAGHPLRATVSEVGPLLLSRLLQLNEVQAGVLNVAFRAADDHGLLLLDLKDLRSLLQFLGENRDAFTVKYGNISPASVGAIQRALLSLEEQGGDHFFGEPALNIEDFLQADSVGRGYINILAAEKLLLSPMMYSTFLLWLLSELFENLPEVGDLERPKLVFFFDEAHLLFSDAPKALIERIEQVVRLIRSKGVGVYFVSQSSLDISETVLGQLGNRVQHALRAFTPKDQRTVRAAAETFRSDGSIDIEAAIMELQIGEAIVSLLDESGTPGTAIRATIAPPRSRIGPVTDEERAAVMKQSLVGDYYDTVIDRESAHEVLTARRASSGYDESSSSKTETPRSIFETVLSRQSKGKNARQSPIEAFIVSAARSVGNQLGRQLFRGVLGSLLGKRSLAAGKKL
jgi:uncharacterized protein